MAHTPSTTMSEQDRRRSSSGISHLHRRFAGLSTLRRSSETSDEVRGSLGLNLIHEPLEPLIDFIFVHGLRGGSRKTWSKTESIDHYWPHAWLPLEPEFKNTRIHSFGYNSDWGERKGSALNIHDFGQALIGDIQTSPHLSAQQTPLVFVGHSMGGIVIKKALLLAKRDPDLHGLAARFQSIFFLATPHRGADSAEMLESIMRISGSTKAYVGDITPGSAAIQSINDEFRHVYQGIQLWSFFETVSTNLGLIVKKESAVLELPGENVHLLNADHRNVCKFEDPSDNNYRTLRNAFASAISTIENSWLSTRRNDHRSSMIAISSYLDTDEQQEADLSEVVEKRTDGSCRWLTDEKSFQHWQEGHDDAPKIFWLTGEPGTGKTVLSGHVTSYLEERNSDCSYFFFKHGDATRSSVSDLLRSLAWQMAYTNTAIRQQLLEMQENGECIDKHNERSLWKSIFASRIFQLQLRQPCRWVIDALDECSNNTVLFPLLAKISRNFPLRVFLTSRPSLSLDLLCQSEKISVTMASTTQSTALSDIRLFVNNQKTYLPVDEHDEEGRGVLIDNIVQKSNGNFLWASLVIQELRTANSEAQIRDILASVPTEMDHFYRRILRGISSTPRNVPMAQSILRWTVCAARPLTTEELKEAIKLDIGEVVPRLDKKAGAICGHLVFVDKTMRVRITHATVRAFLISEDHQLTGETSAFAIKRTEEHSRLAKLCLDYLSGPEMSPPRYRLGRAQSRQAARSAFAAYAVGNFAEHIAKATSAEDAHLIALNNFLGANVLTWIEVVASSGDLQPLAKAVSYLKIYIERRAKYLPPIGIEIQKVTSWTNDLHHVIAEFGKTILAAPASIHSLIPPLCPATSMIRQASQSNPRGLRVAGLSQQAWDDRLSSMNFPNTRILSVSTCDNRIGLGLFDHSVRVFDNTTFQEEIQLNTGGPVRNIKFANKNAYLVTASRTTLQLWNVAAGTLSWHVDLPGLVLAIEFSEDDTQLMVATQANTMMAWRVTDGVLVDVFAFNDVDEDAHTDYRYQRPATFAAISPELGILAVAYRQRPVTLWDLKEKALHGQFHMGAKAYPWPLVVALLFNPQPDLCLAAVAYHSGDIVVLDLESLDERATVTAEASVLAVSPNGTVLAAGHGSSGVVSLYDFETLRLIYRLNSYEEDIKMMSFSSDSLRLFDIRGAQCNVWEPSVLERQTDPGDDSSFGFSEEVGKGPQFVTSRMHDDSLVITALVAHHNTDAIFCGRENGSVAMYSGQSGMCVKELFDRGQNAAILGLTWSAESGLLAMVDRSTHLVILPVSVKVPSEPSVKNAVLDIHMGSQIKQVIFDPQGCNVLISTTETDAIWSIESRSQQISLGVETSRESWTWAIHPTQPSHLVLVCNGHARIYTWDKLVQVSSTAGVQLQPSLDSTLLVSDAICIPMGRNLCIRLVRPRTSKALPQLCLWPASSLNAESNVSHTSLSYPTLATEIKCIVGLLKTAVVFLSHDGWVCSLRLDSIAEEQTFMRHFFVPFGWHSISDNLSMGVTEKGLVFMAVKDELFVFHGGLDMKQPVQIRNTAPNPATQRRTLLRRGHSEF